jgi:hypothetical protein
MQLFTGPAIDPHEADFKNTESTLMSQPLLCLKPQVAVTNSLREADCDAEV